MNNSKKMNYKIKGFEVVILFVIALVFVMTIYFNLTYKQKIYALNIEIQDLEDDIDEQTNLNLAFRTEINDSISFEKLSRLADEYGLVTGNSSTFVLEE